MDQRTREVASAANAAIEKVMAVVEKLFSKTEIADRVAVAVIFEVPGHTGMLHGCAGLDESGWLTAMANKVGRGKRPKAGETLREKQDSVGPLARKVVDAIPEETPLVDAALALATAAAATLQTMGVPEPYVAQVIDTVAQLVYRAQTKDWPKGSVEKPAPEHNWTGTVGQG